QRRGHSQRGRPPGTHSDAHCCALPRVTSTVCGLPDGSRYVSVTLSPGAFDRTAATSASALPITRSSTLVTTTPLGSPASAAAPPLVTSTIFAPSTAAKIV